MRKESFCAVSEIIFPKQFGKEACLMKNKNCSKEKNCSKKSTSAKNEQNGVSMFSKADPNGMYTGTPKNKTDLPTQDADDL